MIQISRYTGIVVVKEPLSLEAITMPPMTLIPAEDILTKYRSKGWQIGHCLGDCYLLFSAENQVLLVPCYEHNAALIDVREMLNYTPVKYAETVKLAQATLTARNTLKPLSWTLMVSGTNLKTMFEELLPTLGDFNRAAGGSGFSCRLLEADEEKTARAAIRLTSLAEKDSQRLADYRVLAVLARIVKDRKSAEKSTLPCNNTTIARVVEKINEAELLRWYLRQGKASPEKDLHLQIDNFTREQYRLTELLRKWDRQNNILAGDRAILQDMFREGQKEFRDDPVLTYYLRKAIIKPPASSLADSEDYCWEMIQGMTALPTPRGVAMQIIQLVEKAETTVEQLIQVIRHDAAITARLLRLANSAMAGQKSRVTTLERAVLIFGFETVKNLAIGFSLIEQKGPMPSQAFNLSLFWLESLSRAITAQHFTKELHLMSTTDEGGRKLMPPTEMFTAGLLSKIGQLALMRVFPQEYGELLALSAGKENTLPTMEQEKFHCDHNHLSSRMMKAWYLPECYCAAAAIQADPFVDATDDVSLVGRLLHLANEVARVLNQPEKTNSTILQNIERQAEAMGIARGSFAEHFQKIGREINDVCGLFELSLIAVPNWQAMESLTA